MEFKYHVDSQNSGRTVKSILRNEFEFSGSLIKKIKYHGKILCNDTPVFINHTVKTDDVVEAHIDFEETSENVKPVPMDLCILYEDDCIVALDKPPGIIIHPIGSNHEHTIANGLAYYFESKGHPTKIRPVSRLDRDTTGVIVFAKNEYVHERLIHQMKENQYQKKYIGIVHGCPTESSGTIKLSIARSPGSIILREISPSGAPSLTHYAVIEYLENAAIVSFILGTGRTHQIRVHCQAIGHPLIGDTLYSDIETTLIGRQALHSQYVKLIHPISKKNIEIVSPLPQDMSKLLDTLKASGDGS